jgi:hypothetical protein
LGSLVLAGISGCLGKRKNDSGAADGPTTVPPTETPPPTPAAETTTDTETADTETTDPEESALENPIPAENDLPGDSGWRPGGSPDDPRSIEGYTTADSVTPGESLEFCVSTDPAARYHVVIYRLGWYDGAGGRELASLPTNRSRPRPIPEPSGPRQLIECDWPVTDRINVPEEWVSGLYIARFVLDSGSAAGESTAYPFVVREPSSERRAKAVVQLPLATQQAYDGWGGKGLYAFVSDGGRAYAISYDRPYENPFNCHLGYSIHLLRWLEQVGYHVSYVSDHDVHCDPALLTEYGMAISSGHDEYWSLEQRRGFETARDGGTNLAFIGSDTCRWQVRYRDNGRTMVCYKNDAERDPTQGLRTTDKFRSGRYPEAALLGVESAGGGEWEFPDLSVVNGRLDHPWFDDTGFEQGDTVIGCVGHEWDHVVDASPDDVEKLFHYEKGTSSLEGVLNNSDADTTVYDRNGGQVFATGTMGWTWRIDPDPTWDQGNWPFNRMREVKPAIERPDPRLQRFTENALTDLIEGS